MVVVGVLVVAVVVVRAVVVVVVGKVVVTEAVRSATVVLVVVVVVVGSGRLAAMRPAYPYPLAQTKYELCMLSDRRAQVSILKKCNQTQRNPLYIK